MTLGTERNTTVRLRIALLVCMAICGGAVLALFADGGAPGPAPTTLAALSPAEQAYVDTIGVRILAMNDEIQAITRLVATHSRNVLELNRRGSRVEALAAEIDTFRDQAPVPERFAALDREATSATSVALDAIAQARSALQSFDFSHIADLIPSFDRAAGAMNDAAATLESIIGPATPVAIRPLSSER